MLRNLLCWVLAISCVSGYLQTHSLLRQTVRRATRDQQQGVPSRFDTCRVLVSGMIGTQPKSMHLKNGHYVVNFALAVVGHFKAIHELEYFKPAEAMWISVELWDELARQNAVQYTKGSMIYGVGYMVQNKWIDKLSGEERKMYKMRLTKTMSNEEFSHVTSIFEDTVKDSEHNERSRVIADSDSAFSVEAPPESDQTSLPYNPQSVNYDIGMSFNEAPDSALNHKKSTIGKFGLSGDSAKNIDRLSPERVNALWQKASSKSDVESNYLPWWGE